MSAWLRRYSLRSLVDCVDSHAHEARAVPGSDRKRWPVRVEDRAAVPRALPRLPPACAAAAEGDPIRLAPGVPSFSWCGARAPARLFQLPPGVGPAAARQRFAAQMVARPRPCGAGRSAVARPALSQQWRRPALLAHGVVTTAPLPTYPGSGAVPRSALGEVARLADRQPLGDVALARRDRHDRAGVVHAPQVLRQLDQ